MTGEMVSDARESCDPPAVTAPCCDFVGYRGKDLGLKSPLWMIYVALSAHGILARGKIESRCFVTLAVRQIKSISGMARGERDRPFSPPYGRLAENRQRLDIAWQRLDIV